jgi:hypothetical protein
MITHLPRYPSRPAHRRPLAPDSPRPDARADAAAPSTRNRPRAPPAASDLPRRPAHRPATPRHSRQHPWQAIAQHRSPAI